MADLLAKPFGEEPITLESHTKHVVSEAKQLLEARPFWSKKYHQITGNDLKKQVLRVAELHDKGKAHEIWQSACRKDRTHYLKTGERNGEHLRRCGLRHEFATLWWAKKHHIDLTLAEMAAIAAHHRKLSYRHEHRWTGDDQGSFKDIWQEFRQLDYRLNTSQPEALKDVLIDRYNIAGVRSLLQLADTRASRQEAGYKLPLIDQSFDYSFDYVHKRPVQQAALDHSDKQELILRAPTGSGKTDAALLWAKQQIKNEYADRLVIAMPTRFTSTSLDLDISQNVSSTGLYHSSAWFARYKGESERGGKSRDYMLEIIRMARILVMPATTSTVDHLLMALGGTREDHHGIFFNLVNSCVVIDEADFYDEFVQANITKLLEVLRIFNVRVLVMSATVPESAKDLYNIDHLIDPYTANTAVRTDKSHCNIIQEGPAEHISEVSHILQPLLDEEPPCAIIYANTVSRALEYFDWFVEHGIEPILYHSRFTEPDKKHKEEELLTALGKHTWAKRQAQGIAILTQIGEMSLNISAPLMVSDLCPMDRLAQRAGRLSRFEGMAPGKLHVITPMKDGQQYPAPYGEYDREEKAWKPGTAFSKTRQMLTDGPYTAKDFVDAVNNLYPESDSFSLRASLNKNELDKLLKRNWLINPGAEASVDDFETPEWQCRDIPPQRIVLTQRPNDFDNVEDYRRFELEHGISCPIWQIETGKKLQRIADVPFYRGDEEATMPYSSCYSPSEGLILSQKRSNPLGNQPV